MNKEPMSIEGYDLLVEEFKFLLEVEKPKTAEEKLVAAAQGDRSENADYQYNKKKLREIDRRVRYLRKCLENLKVVDYDPQQEGRVFFGAWVEIENESGTLMTLRLVGYDEIFGRKDYISIDSPMARALVGKEEDDEFVVVTDTGTKAWWINRIWYDSTDKL